MFPSRCINPPCKNMLLNKGPSATLAGACPARNAGIRAGIVAFASRKALAAFGDNVIWYRNTSTFAEISITLTKGKFRVGLISFSGIIQPVYRAAPLFECGSKAAAFTAQRFEPKLELELVVWSAKAEAPPPHS